MAVVRAEETCEVTESVWPRSPAADSFPSSSSSGSKQWSVTMSSAVTMTWVVATGAKRSVQYNVCESLVIETHELCFAYTSPPSWRP